MDIVRVDLLQNNIYLLGLGDVHHGSQYCREDILDGYIQWVLDHENAYVILGGDLGEYPTRGSKTEPWSMNSAPQEQLLWELEKFTPIRDRILGVIQGNHEYRLYDYSGFDPSMILASQLGVPYGQYGIYLSVKLNNTPTNGCANRCTIYATHGWGGSRKAGAKVLKVEELAHTIHANVVMMFHDHFMAAHRIAYKIPSGNHNRLVDYRKVLVNCGSFLDYGGYSQAKGYAPADLGTPRIRIEWKRMSADGVDDETGLSDRSAYYDIHVST